MFFNADLDWTFGLADVAGWAILARDPVYDVLCELRRDRGFRLREKGTEVRRRGVGDVDGIFP